MSYCLNPKCPHPENLSFLEQCQSCGSRLLLRDRYRVIKALAHGGFGATFVAQDEGLPGKPECLVKQLRPKAHTPEVLVMARELFAREAKTLGKIGSHPQVPRLLDYFEDSQQFYLVQEYISGLTLQQEVENFGLYSEASVKQFLSEFLPLLQYIHDQKVIHRDIKPANLIRRSEDRKLVLIDFGAVKDQVNQTKSHLGHTVFTAFALGTQGFMPPEQIALRPVYASDIYALGMTCIYLLTGKSPKNIDYNPLTGEILWKNKLVLSDHLGKVLSKMLEVSLQYRYQSATEVLKALELEPYLDSLVKGMATPNQSDGPASPPGDSYAPTVVKMAVAIRALRTELKVKKPKHRKLDTDSLITAYVKGRRNFTLHDLNLLDLQQANLPAANFQACKLDRTNFHKANLVNSNFSKASLKQANLREANLSKADLNDADLEEADLRGADLSYAYLIDANLRGANLCGANLTGAKVSKEKLAQAKTNWMTVQPNGKRRLL